LLKERKNKTPITKFEINSHDFVSLSSSTSFFFFLFCYDGMQIFLHILLLLLLFELTNIFRACFCGEFKKQEEEKNRPSLICLVSFFSFLFFLLLLLFIKFCFCLPFLYLSYFRNKCWLIDLKAVITIINNNNTTK